MQPKNVIKCFRHDIIGLQIPTTYNDDGLPVPTMAYSSHFIGFNLPNSSACSHTTEVIKTHPPLHVLSEFMHNAG